MDRPERKPNRLPGYDYSTPGAYFITICTKDRKCILSDITVGATISRPPEVRLTDYGKAAEKAILDIPIYYPIVTVDRYAIMPNHIHLLLTVTEGDCGQNGESGRLVVAPTATPTISRLVQQLKMRVSRETGEKIWQKSFHDHIVRDENDYRKIWEYVDSNAQKWREDCFFMPEEMQGRG